MGKIVSLTGASGAGKDAIARALRLPYLTSTTTRLPRPADWPGEYEFLDLEDFNEQKAWGAFVWDKEYSGNYYGTKYEIINKALTNPEYSVMTVLHEIVPLLLEYARTENVLPFYIRSPSEEVLRQRMQQRGDKSDSIERRLKENRDLDWQVENSDLPYIFITNNGTIEEAVGKVKEYLK